MTSICIACQPSFSLLRFQNHKEISTSKMEWIFNYFSYLSLLFAYCSLGSKILLFIFALLTLSISSKRSFLFLATIGILFDVLLASLGAYAMARPIPNLNNIPFTVYELWRYHILWNSGAFLFVLLYTFIRLHIYLMMTETDPWDESSLSIRASYIVQYFFSCTIAPMIAVNSGILAICGLLNLLFAVFTRMNLSMNANEK